MLAASRSPSLHDCESDGRYCVGLLGTVDHTQERAG